MPEEFVPAEPGTPEYDRRFDEVLAIMSDESLTEEEALAKIEQYPDQEVAKDVTDMLLSLLVPTNAL